MLIVPKASRVHSVLLFVGIVVVRGLLVPDYRLGVWSIVVIQLLIPIASGYLGTLTTVWIGLLALTVAEAVAGMHYALSGGWNYLFGDADNGLTQSIVIGSFMMQVVVAMTSLLVFSFAKKVRQRDAA